MKEIKGKYPKQHDKEKREVVYSQIAQNMEKHEESGKKFHKLSIYYFS